MPFPLLFAIAIATGSPNVTQPPPGPPTTIVAPAAPAPPTTPERPETQLHAPLSPPKAKPGHYTCDSMELCTIDPDPDPHPANPGDQPGQTLGTTDPAYGARLTEQVCEAMPWRCEP